MNVACNLPDDDFYHHHDHVPMRSFKMTDQDRLCGFHWRPKPSSIIVTVTLGLFTDLFFYGIMVPVLPFMLRDRLSIPGSQIQSCTSSLIAAYAGPSVLFSLPPGWVADKIGSRQPTFVADLWMQVMATMATSFGQRAAIVITARFLQCSSLAAAVVQVTGLAMVQDAAHSRNIGKVTGMLSHGQTRRSYQDKAS